MFCTKREKTATDRSGLPSIHSERANLWGARQIAEKCATGFKKKNIARGREKKTRRRRKRRKGKEGKKV